MIVGVQSVKSFTVLLSTTAEKRISSFLEFRLVLSNDSGLVHFRAAMSRLISCLKYKKMYQSKSRTLFHIQILAGLELGRIDVSLQHGCANLGVE